MKATGALPTEERVKKMNSYQWLWYYLNIMEEKKKNNEERDNIIEYLTYFMNHELARTVHEKRESEKNKKYKEQNIQYSNEVYNDSFDEEIAKALQGQKVVELPSSNYKSSTESKDDFIERAIKIEQFVKQYPDNIYTKEIITNKNKIKPSKKIKDLSEEEILNMNSDNDLDIFVTDD